MKIFTLALFTVFAAIAAHAASFDNATYNDFMKKVKTGTDASAAEKWVDSIETTKTEEKIKLLRLYSWTLVKQGNVPTFAEFQQKMDNKIASLKVELAPHQILGVKNVWVVKEYWEPMLKYIETFPVEERMKFSDYGHYLGMAGRYQEAADHFAFTGRYHSAVNYALTRLKDVKKAYTYAEEGLSRPMSSVVASSLINHICTQFTVTDQLTDQQVKSLLQRYQRKFVGNLAKDKSTWEPIIVQIKLTLSSY